MFRACRGRESLASQGPSKWSDSGSFYRLDAIDFVFSSPYTSHYISISRAAIDD
jgi:hypothetical protein